MPAATSSSHPRTIILADNELLESVKSNVLAFAYFSIRHLMETYTGETDYVTTCNKKAAVSGSGSFPLPIRGGILGWEHRPVVVGINSDENYYNYEHGDESVEFYVSFANRKLFGSFRGQNLPLSSEEVRAMEFPIPMFRKITFPIHRPSAQVMRPLIDESTHIFISQLLPME
ncbi:hypothetical protein HK098_003331 [Nowakowskiella sp. JEL0407]|nr:hypothetical protein HK098_003331 [Nowakowskiella sp. JEL0407]